MSIDMTNVKAKKKAMKALNEVNQMLKKIYKTYYIIPASNPNPCICYGEPVLDADKFHKPYGGTVMTLDTLDDLGLPLLAVNDTQRFYKMFQEAKPVWWSISANEAGIDELMFVDEEGKEYASGAYLAVDESQEKWITQTGRDLLSGIARLGTKADKTFEIAEDVMDDIANRKIVDLSAEADRCNTDVFNDDFRMRLALSEFPLIKALPLCDVSIIDYDAWFMAIFRSKNKNNTIRFFMPRTFLKL